MRGLYDSDGFILDAVAEDFTVHPDLAWEDWSGTILVTPDDSFRGFESIRVRDSYVATVPGTFTTTDNTDDKMLNETGEGLIPYEEPVLTALEKLEAATGLTKAEINEALA